MFQKQAWRQDWVYNLVNRTLFPAESAFGWMGITKTGCSSPNLLRSAVRVTKNDKCAVQTRLQREILREEYPNSLPFAPVLVFFAQDTQVDWERALFLRTQIFYPRKEVVRARFGNSLHPKAEYAGIELVDCVWQFAGADLAERAMLPLLQNDILTLRAASANLYPLQFIITNCNGPFLLGGTALRQKRAVTFQDFLFFFFWSFLNACARIFGEFECYALDFFPTRNRVVCATWKTYPLHKIMKADFLRQFFYYYLFLFGGSLLTGIYAQFIVLQVKIYTVCTNVLFIL